MSLHGSARLTRTFLVKKRNEAKKRTPKKTLHAQGLAHGCRFLGGVASFRVVTFSEPLIFLINPPSQQLWRTKNDFADFYMCVVLKKVDFSVFRW